ncbi:MAG TPA: 1-(5-phosphoribosyl)-5-[(5-phosphoribosylamino)methylideneamino]imidazole-4-carboxamide isomerase [Armatimonadota bacterium]|jgi:phosphoribosylformimino-5-aminoimidazole carboxamide ribotide isomerase
MIVIPAIDIRGGQCVRLHQGDYAQETVYGADPVEMALRWEAEGGERLHVVDLDGARDGTGANRAAIGRIAQALKIPVQTGGGLRTQRDIQEVLDLGVQRCIVGTTAALESAAAQALFERFGDKLILGLDAKGGYVAIRGWRETTDQTALDFARDMVARGAQRIIYTDVARDGAMQGPNVTALEAMAKEAGVPIIASGGVSRIEDFTALKRLEPLGVEAAITGKALYVGAFTLADAIAAARQDPTA